VIRVRRDLAFVVLVLAAVACPSASNVTSPGPPSGVPSSAPVTLPSVEPGGARTAEAAIKELCVPPKGTGGPPVPRGGTPPEIADVEHQVEDVRGLLYEHPVAVTSVDGAEMDRLIQKSFDASYPKTYYDRRTAAWRTIGVIPPGVDLRASLRSFLTGQVVGFYDPDTGRLVYQRSGALGLEERFVLAHELTHAIDDQHFDLSRLDGLARSCADEASSAALGAVEGSAQYFATQVIARNPSTDLGDLVGAILQGLGAQQDLAGVPPFVQTLEEWPYTTGLAFITQLAATGGTDAVNHALVDPPATTEQVIHPDRYPTDTPTAVDIPDLSTGLGPRWGDLDAMEVGEGWVDAMLQLRLDGSTASAGAAGWAAGVYRAWTDGHDVAVVLRTAWDSEREAAQFMRAASSWEAACGGSSTATQSGSTVTMTFATSSRVSNALTSLSAS